MTEPVLIRYGAVPVRATPDGAVKILLVRSRRGRWIFPKGKLEPGESARIAAQRECLEEAGVRGELLDGAPFPCELDASERADGNACVQSLRLWLRVVRDEVGPAEMHRMPTWFTLSHARAALSEDRLPATAEQLLRVVDWVETSVLGS